MKTKTNIVAMILTAISLMPFTQSTVNAQQIRAHITIGTPPVYPDNGEFYYPQSRFYNGSNSYYRYNTVHPYYGYRHQHGEYGSMRHDRNFQDDRQHGWNGHDNGHHYGERHERR